MVSTSFYEDFKRANPHDLRVHGIMHVHQQLITKAISKNNFETNLNATVTLSPLSQEVVQDPTSWPGLGKIEYFNDVRDLQQAEYLMIMMMMLFTNDQQLHYLLIIYSYVWIKQDTWCIFYFVSIKLQVRLAEHVLTLLNKIETRLPADSHCSTHILRFNFATFSSLSEIYKLFKCSGSCNTKCAWAHNDSM